VVEETFNYWLRPRRMTGAGARRDGMSRDGAGRCFIACFRLQG